MNYLELINLTLQELNFKPVSSFSALVKPDHQKIATIVSRVNDILLDSVDWEFMLREIIVDVEPGQDRVRIPCEMKIKHLYLEDRELCYTSECERFLGGKGRGGYYSIFNDHILVAPEDEPRKMVFVFITRNHAKNAAGKEIPALVNADDVTLVPDEFAKTTIVFGACCQFKANPALPKYNYWLRSFTDARAKMRSSCEYLVSRPPEILMSRWTVGLDFFNNVY